MLMNSREIWRSLQCAPQFARVSQPHMPLRSALPSAVRGAGADRFGLPSAVRGTPGVGCSSHWAEPAPASATHHITVHSRRDVDRMTAHLRVRGPRYGYDERLPLLKLHAYASLDGADHTRDGGAVGGDLSRKVPRLRVGEFPVHLTLFHGEALERLIDLSFLRKSRADQLADECAIRVPRELQLDVVVDRRDTRPPDPRPGERVGNARVHLDRGRRFRLRVRTLEARRRDVVRHDRVPLMAGVLPPLVLRIVAHRIAHGERAREDDGILRLD